MPRHKACERLRLSAEEIDLLRRKALHKPETASFFEDVSFYSVIAALGISREVGTGNDEMARFIFDAETGNLVPREHLRAELIRYKEKVGVRIWAEGHPKIELRFYGIQSLVHPELSFNDDGSLSQIVIFPEAVAKIAALEGVDVAFVRPWAMNTVFELHPSQSYYLTNIYELKNNDALRFASLVEKGQVPFLGTHDLVAHIAGTKAEAWQKLRERGSEVRQTLTEFLGQCSAPWIGSLILPYLAGILLDDLTQPPVYGAETRSIPLEEVLTSIRSKSIDPKLPAVLTRYPEHHEKLIELARFESLSEVQKCAKDYVRKTVEEINWATAMF